jgi:hypothetical protein
MTLNRSANFLYNLFFVATINITKRKLPMSHSLKTGARSHLNSILNQCKKDRAHLFEQVFSNKSINKYLKEIEWRERIFSPLVTVWVFINQILDKDHSCRAAVSTLITLRSFLKISVNSIATGAYCKARKRLPLTFIKYWVKDCAQRLRDRTHSLWLWKGFEILLIDGSQLSMPDTPENRKTFYSEGSGFGLVKARILGVFSLGCGCLAEFKLSPWVGKGTGEVSLFRHLVNQLHEGQLVVMDRLFGGYVDMGLLTKNGVDFVIRTTSRQKNRKGHNLGKGDYLIELDCPWQGAESVGYQYVDQIPKKLIIRQVKICLKQKGFRPKEIFLFTSLKDSKKYTIEEIAQLYKWRWNVEVDFRSIKIGLGLNIMRCKTPEMVEKEILMHILVYNMIRVIMADSAIMRKLKPRQISFQECVQLFRNFRLIFCIYSSKEWNEIYENLLKNIKSKVGNRPDRREPRLLKNHYPRKYDSLNVPRDKAKYHFCKKGSAYIVRQQQI